MTEILPFLSLCRHDNLDASIKTVKVPVKKRHRRSSPLPISSLFELVRFCLNMASSSQRPNTSYSTTTSLSSRTLSCLDQSSVWNEAPSFGVMFYISFTYLISWQLFEFWSGFVWMWQAPFKSSIALVQQPWSLLSKTLSCPDQSSVWNAAPTLYVMYSISFTYFLPNLWILVRFCLNVASCFRRPSNSCQTTWSPSSKTLSCPDQSSGMPPRLSRHSWRRATLRTARERRMDRRMGGRKDWAAGQMSWRKCCRMVRILNFSFCAQQNDPSSCVANNCISIKLPSTVLAILW